MLSLDDISVETAGEILPNTFHPLKYELTPP